LAGTINEKARLKLAAATAMLKIVGNDAITAGTTAQGETTIIAASTPASQIMTPTQWHTLATVLLSEEEFVRDKFALKLHKGINNDIKFKDTLSSFINLNFRLKIELNCKKISVSN